MKKIEKDANELEKYQKTTEILKMIVYVLLSLAFFYLAGYAFGKSWAYYTQWTTCEDKRLAIHSFIQNSVSKLKILFYFLI